MKSFFLSVRSGLLAIGALAGLTAPSLAGPSSFAVSSVPAVNGGAVAPVAEPVAYRCGPGMNCNGNWNGNRNRSWNGGNWNREPHWKGNDVVQRRYSRSGNWNNGSWVVNGGVDNSDWKWKKNNNWKWKHNNDRRWRNNAWNRRNHFRSGVILGLGLGLPAYNYYAQPQYRYVQPRRVYRTQTLSSAHVQWCYDRYRSYRAYDNSFQPYHGPRQQCYSPYS